MSLMNAMSATLIILILSAGLALFLGMRSAEAGVYQTPAGGWGVDRPAPTGTLDRGGR